MQAALIGPSLLTAHFGTLLSKANSRTDSSPKPVICTLGSSYQSRALFRQNTIYATISAKFFIQPAVKTTRKGRRLYGSLSKLGTTFVTTNYDEWLDTVISAPTQSLQANLDPALSSREEARTVFYDVVNLTADNLRPNTVIHLHGSLNNPASMILTTQDYVRHYANDRYAGGAGKENNVLTFLDFLFRQRNVLFVGFSDLQGRPPETRTFPGGGALRGY